MSALTLLILAAEPVALIWGGGKSHNDAERALTAYQEKVAHEPVTLGEGFPRIVESASIDGLKPGFHVVLLGICPENDEALAYFKSLDERTYQRRVSGVALACPRTPSLGASDEGWEGFFDCPAVETKPPFTLEKCDNGPTTDHHWAIRVRVREGDAHDVLASSANETAPTCALGEVKGEAWAVVACRGYAAVVGSDGMVLWGHEAERLRVTPTAKGFDVAARDEHFRLHWKNGGLVEDRP